MNKADFLYMNIQPALAIKIACRETNTGVVIEDGVIIDLVKENQDGGRE